VVVRAPGDQRRQSVGSMVGADEQVGGGFAGAVRGGGQQRAVLGPGAVGDRPVDLVGGDVHEPGDLVPACRFQQVLGGDDVGEHEVGSTCDGAVDVGLRGKVHDLVDTAHHLVDGLDVADVALDERQPWGLCGGREVLPVAG